MVTAVSMIEDEINDIVNKHGALLRKGLNLSHIPTVNEVLKRSLPSPSPTSGIDDLYQLFYMQEAWEFSKQFEMKNLACQHIYLKRICLKCI